MPQARVCRSIFGFVLLSACADFTVGYRGDSPTQSGVASEPQEEAASAPALCHTSRLLENRNTSRSCLPGAMTWSARLEREPQQSTEVPCSGCRHPGGPPSAWDNRRGTRNGSPHAHVGVFGQSTMDVSRLFLPELRVARLLPLLQSLRQLWGTWQQWRWQSCKEAGSTSDFRGLPLGGVRKVARRRLSQLAGDGSRGFGSSQGREQDRLKALDASIANLEKARGGKPDVAIDEVLRQKRLERQELKDQMQSRKSTKALLKAAIAARAKGGHQARGFAEGRDGSDAAAVAETTGDFGCEERSRREGARGRNVAGEGVWPRSIAKGRFLMSHLLHLALRHCHLSSGRLDLRRRFQRTFESSSRSGTAASRSRPRRQWIHIRRV